MTITETTRRDSFDKTKPDIGPKQLSVYTLLQRHPGGLSAWDISARLGWMIHVTRPRITELQHMGLIEAFDKAYHEGTQRHEAVWRTKRALGPLFDRGEA
jgi:hypothetical protein